MAERAGQHIWAIITVFKDLFHQTDDLGWFVCSDYGCEYWRILTTESTYPDPPRPPDRILDWIPQNIDFLQYGEYLSRAQIVVMFFFFLAVPERLRRFPKMLFLLCVMFTLRAFAITLTPLAQITPPAEYFEKSNFFAQTFYQGMFFSGHSSSALIQAFFLWPYRFKGIRVTWFVLPFALGQIASMLIGHQHYSIDIFAAFFVVYFILTFDFMLLVPDWLRYVHWMPWFTGQQKHEFASQLIANGITSSEKYPEAQIVVHQEINRWP
jgi:hypothetical protein